MKHICPTLATFLLNCYNIPAKLFVLGGKDLLSHKSTTLGDLIAMEIYGIKLTPLVKYLANSYPETGQK